MTRNKFASSELRYHMNSNTSIFSLRKTAAPRHAGRLGTLHAFPIPIPLFAAAACIIFPAQISHAQDLLKILPAYERYQKISRELTNAVSTGPRSISWKDGGKAVEYQLDGKRYRYEILSGKLTDLGSAPARESTQDQSETQREGRRNR